MKEVISFRLDSDEKELLNSILEKTGSTKLKRSDVMREALYDYFLKLEDKTPRMKELQKRAIINEEQIHNKYFFKQMSFRTRGIKYFCYCISNHVSKNFIIKNLTQLSQSKYAAEEDLNFFKEFLNLFESNNWREIEKQIKANSNTFALRKGYSELLFFRLSELKEEQKNERKE
jgi:hypothetical protein